MYMCQYRTIRAIQGGTDPEAFGRTRYIITARRFNYSMIMATSNFVLFNLHDIHIRIVFDCSSGQGVIQ